MLAGSALVAASNNTGIATSNCVGDYGSSMTVPVVKSRSPASLSVLSGRAFMAANSNADQSGVYGRLKLQHNNQC